MGRLTPIDGFMTIPQYGCTVYNPTFDHDTSTCQWRVYKWCDLGMRDSSGMTSQRVAVRFTDASGMVMRVFSLKRKHDGFGWSEVPPKSSDLRWMLNYDKIIKTCLN